ncbi:hypothetical protein [Calidifontibacter indicus]|uniref:hypothetical protein n=1 Tax=Calidifontibacter indicus TaxID=419650 RepID=UPI003D73901F
MAGAGMYVLLEGASDIAAVRALADDDLDGVRLVDLQGVTNVRRVLRDLRQRDPDATVLGMCDAGEVRFVERAVREAGRPVRDVSDLPAYGFFVCVADLEDELIRALGVDRVLLVVQQLGLAGKFATLQQQPDWQGRPVEEQLHRFCGVASGRKELLARELASALGLDDAPEPLRALLDRIRHLRKFAGHVM